jgi:mRNA-degrading endonuclease toxin of MazEF toxin-antitoxin module
LTLLSATAGLSHRPTTRTRSPTGSSDAPASHASARLGLLRVARSAAVWAEPFAALPGNVLVGAELSGLPRDSVVNVTQVATIDRSVLEERVAAPPDWLLVQVDPGLRRALGLTHA